jgi:hypothetical protein
MTAPHYLRFARALALVAVLPACTGNDPTPRESPDPAVDEHSDAGDAVADAGAAHEDDADADMPFSSGPIVPPELPAGFA